MQRRILGGIAGWLIGVLPLIGVNAAYYLGVYFNPIFALLVSLLLGSAVAGYIGGKSDGRSAGGSVGAGVSGGISAVLYAVTLVGLLLVAQSVGVLGSIMTGQIFHITVVILFVAALWLGIAMLTGFLTGTRENRRETMSSTPRGQVRQPGSSYRQDAPLRYTGNSADTTSPRGGPYDSRRYEPGNLRVGRPAGQRQSDRDPRRS